MFFNKNRILSKYPLRLESFYSLSLNLPQTKPSINDLLDPLSINGFTLYELFYNYFKPEHLTEMKCENCSKVETSLKKKGFIKKQAIAKLPETLALHIQRNSWSGNNLEMIKQTNYVQFPLEIKIDNAKADSAPNIYYNKNNFSSLYKFVPGSFSLKQVGIGGLLGGKSLIKKSINTNEIKTSNFMRTQSEQSEHRYELKSAVVHYGISKA